MTLDSPRPDSPPASPLIFSEVSVRLGERLVLEGFSAEAASRGFTFVLGASGAGKSVLCRSAVGLLPIERGEIHLLGDAVAGASERTLLALRRRAPYVVQGPALLDWHTLLSNVALAASDRTRARAALAELGLEPFADRLPHEVGPGVQKRCAIARALVLDPEVLLLDEPTTGLDRDATHQVLRALSDVRGRGLPAVVVSHDYEAVAALADRVWVVANGRCVFSGSAADFFASPLPEVRALTAPDEVV